MNPRRTRSTSTPSTPRVQERFGQTSCLFCYTPVCININLEETVPSPEDMERRKWIQNLCNYRGINFMIPEKCSETIFPFCEDCKQRLDQLSFHMENLEETFNWIESEVADGEIKRMSSVGSAVLQSDEMLEKQKCSFLRDFLLQGYRNKLWDKQRQKSTQIKNTSQFSSSSASVTDLRRASRSISPSSSSNMTPKRSYDADATIEIDLGTDEETSDSEDGNENGSFLRISNIRTVARDTKIEGDLDTEVVVVSGSGGLEQEFKRSSSKNAKQDCPLESSDNDEIFELASKRRRKYGGVEIFRVVGSGTRANATDTKSLQCGRCNFTITDKITEKKSGTPMQQMKAHIRDVHLGIIIPGCTTTSKGRVMKNLQYYREVHTCDICGRPVQGPAYMVKQHKFFHMNDAEREAAVNAGLKGLYTLKRLANKQYPKTAALSIERNVPNVAGRTRSRILSQSEEDEKSCVFKCYDCGKIFPNELSLVQHVSRHTTRGPYARKCSVRKWDRSGK